MRALGAMTIVGAIVLACGEDRPLCYPGDFIGCRCDNGTYGYAACGEFAAGPNYGSCSCDGTVPGVDAGPGDAGDAGDASDASDAGDAAEVGQPLFAPCTEDRQCESGLCFEYGDGRLLCTKACASPSDCPPPSTGCNGKGACKPP